MVYKKAFDNKRDALVEERKIKRKKSREYIKRIIEKQSSETGSSISLV
ncbi:MAG: hypothetical protein ABIH71_03025 [Candidatus Omnitrophota bacterium]|nr:hypothetical protein [Candidatus Omnitrophota bacterium]